MCVCVCACVRACVRACVCVCVCVPDQVASVLCWVNLPGMISVILLSPIYGQKYKIAFIVYR